MRKFASIVLFSILLYSGQSLAWSMTGDFRFQQGAKAVTTVVSPSSEQQLFDEAIAQAQVVEESIIVSNVEEPCERPGSNDINCIATALDSSLSVGCTYCASGEAQVLLNGLWQDGDAWDEPCVIYERPGGRD